MSLEHSPARQKKRGKPRMFEDDRYYSARELSDKFGVHIVTIWRWVRLGLLVAPEKVGPNTTRWRGKFLNDADT